MKQVSKTDQKAKREEEKKLNNNEMDMKWKWDTLRKCKGVLKQIPVSLHVVRLQNFLGPYAYPSKS